MESFSEWFARSTGHERPHAWQAEVAADTGCSERLIRVPTGLSRDELVRRRLLRFVRTRTPHKPQPPADRAFGLRISFGQPVHGPITIGYASHYGLGVFAAERPAEPDRKVGEQS